METHYGSCGQHVRWLKRNGMGDFPCGPRPSFTHAPSTPKIKLLCCDDEFMLNYIYCTHSSSNAKALPGKGPAKDCGITPVLMYSTQKRTKIEKGIICGLNPYIFADPSIDHEGTTQCTKQGCIGFRWFFSAQARIPSCECLEADSRWYWC